MNFPLIFIIWAILGPIILWLGWRRTKKSQPYYHRILVRSLIVAFTCGFVGYGGLLPAWALITPQANFIGLLAILIWWVLASVVYFIIHYIFKRSYSG